MNKFILIILMLSINGLLYSQDIRTFEYEKVVIYADSLICNNKISWQDSDDTIIFDAKNRDIYIYRTIEEFTFPKEDTIKLMDTVIIKDWISNLCIGKASLINSKEDIKDI